MSKLQRLIDRMHNPDLAKNSMVYQVWDDGEITMQKAGRLLWARSLHSMKPSIIPDTRIELCIDWPNDNFKHGYAFVTEQDAMTIRNAIKEGIRDIINQS